LGFRDWFGLRRKEPPKPAELHCTFCGKSGVEVKKMIGGPPPLFICDGCVENYSERATREEASGASLRDGCSFCGKGRREVRVLLGGEKTTICDECLGLCRDILEEELRRA